MAYPEHVGLFRVKTEIRSQFQKFFLIIQVDPFFLGLLVQRLVVIAVGRLHGFVDEMGHRRQFFILQGLFFQVIDDCLPGGIEGLHFALGFRLFPIDD